MQQNNYDKRGIIMQEKIKTIRKKMPALTIEQKAIIQLLDESLEFKEALKASNKRIDILEHELRYVKNRGYDHA